MHLAVKNIIFQIDMHDQRHFSSGFRTSWIFDVLNPLRRATIRDDMIDETVAFIADLVASNASVLNIVDSDFAMLNQRDPSLFPVRGTSDSGRGKNLERQRWADYPLELAHRRYRRFRSAATQSQTE